MSIINAEGNYRKFVSVTVQSGANGSSEAVVCAGYKLVGVITPSTWVATNLTFTGTYSTDSGSTFLPVYDAGDAATVATLMTVYSTVVNTAAIYQVNKQAFAGLSQIKVQSVTSQTTTRTVVLVFEAQE